MSQQLHKHRSEHLLLAAKVAAITGDHQGVLAILDSCRNCHPTRDAS